jgi:peptidoglycan/xylan/chitin deacetylase (PgdA/CDA1 family)
MELISTKTKVIRSNYIGELNSNGHYSIITFDDGFENVFNNAVPILTQYSLPFTIFFVSDYFGKNADWEFPDDHPEKNERIMTIDQMNDIPRDLLTVGSHTATHKKLTTLKKEEMIEELKNSKLALEKLTGNEINLIAFPNGLHNSHIVKESLYLGYKRVFTIEPKNATMDQNDKVVGRINVSCDDYNIEFWLKIHGAYQWLNWTNKLKRTSRKS